MPPSLCPQRTARPPLGGRRVQLPQGQPPGQGRPATHRPVQLEDIVITRQLDTRAQREPDWKEQGIALGALAKVLATDPNRVVDTLLETALRICRAETAGLSVQETTPAGDQIYRWTHLAGRLKEHTGGWTPRDFSPCGLCTDTDAPQLLSYPERYFTYFAVANIPFVEALLIPVHVGRTIPATIWILSHTEGKGFDREDVRVLSVLADFAACALGLAPARETKLQVPGTEAGFSAAFELGPGEAGSLNQARSAQLQRLALKLISARDEERKRIARDLRERAGRYLAVLAMNLSELLREKASLTSSQAVRLSDLLQMVHRCTAEIRTISSLLQPPSLEEEGLFTALSWYLEGFTGRSGVQVRFECPPELGRYPSETETAIFRIVQEGLNNIYFHSGSRRATVRITESSGMVHVAILDEGRGITPENLAGILHGTHPIGVGIAEMRERTGMLGGTFRVRSDAGGTSVELSVPAGDKLLRG